MRERIRARRPVGGRPRAPRGLQDVTHDLCQEANCRAIGDDRVAMGTTLTTERLTLRPLTPADVDVLVAIDADVDVMRHINGGRPSSRAEVARVVAASVGHRWLGTPRGGGPAVGWFSLRPAPGDDGDRELGYRLRRDAWGQGLATEGARALVDHAFTALGAHRVWAQTMTVNARSRRVMERCGLRFVRTFHTEWPEVIAGSEHGDVEYALTRAAWEAGGGAAG